MLRLSGKPLPSEAWELVVAALLLGARIAAIPAAGLWRDWFALLCAFWIATVATSRTKAWPPIAGVFMAGLLALYAWGHGGMTLRFLGIGP